MVFSKVMLMPGHVAVPLIEVLLRRGRSLRPARVDRLQVAAQHGRDDARDRSPPCSRSRGVSVARPSRRCGNRERSLVARAGKPHRRGRAAPRRGRGGRRSSARRRRGRQWGAPVSTPPPSARRLRRDAGASQARQQHQGRRARSHGGRRLRRTSRTVNATSGRLAPMAAAPRTLNLKAAPWKIANLAALKRDGRLHLPDLQRGFVWSADRVRALYDSLYRSYPVGALLLWEPKWEGEAPFSTRAWDICPPDEVTFRGTPETPAPGRARLAVRAGRPAAADLDLSAGVSQPAPQQDHARSGSAGGAVAARRVGGEPVPPALEDAAPADAGGAAGAGGGAVRGDPRRQREPGRAARAGRMADRGRRAVLRGARSRQRDPHVDPAGRGDRLRDRRRRERRQRDRDLRAPEPAGRPPAPRRSGGGAPDRADGQLPGAGARGAGDEGAARVLGARGGRGGQPQRRVRRHRSADPRGAVPGRRRRALSRRREAEGPDPLSEHRGELGRGGRRVQERGGAVSQRGRSERRLAPLPLPAVSAGDRGGARPRARRTLDGLGAGGQPVAPLRGRGRHQAGQGRGAGRDAATSTASSSTSSCARSGPRARSPRTTICCTTSSARTRSCSRCSRTSRA